MSQYFKVHPINPQLRLLSRAAEIVRAGGLIVYPTDSTYAFGWHIGDKAALERVRALRGIERDHDFTLACRDLSDIATYARVENWAYRQLKALTPGPYTFVLRATAPGTEAPAGSEKALDRHSRARPHDRAGVARRARRAAHELDAAVAERAACR